MEIDLGAQALALARSFLLGVGFALVYDLLRALRLQRRRQRTFTAVLDAAYTLLLAAGLLIFARRVGGGELRLYMLFAVLTGAAVFFVCFSPPLRPLWEFWAKGLFALLALVQLPLRRAKAFSDKLHKRQKRLFLFYHNSFIIKNCGRAIAAKRRTAEKKEGVSYGGQAEKRQKKRLHRLPHHRAAAPFGAASDEPARENQGGQGRPG